MGAKHWQLLHKLIYALVLPGLTHFIWLRSGKNNFAEPAIYGAVLVLLLGWPVWRNALQRPKLQPMNLTIRS